MCIAQQNCCGKSAAVLLATVWQWIAHYWTEGPLRGGLCCNCGHVVAVLGMADACRAASLWGNYEGCCRQPGKPSAPCLPGMLLVAIAGLCLNTCTCAAALGLQLGSNNSCLSLHQVCMLMCCAGAVQLAGSSAHASCRTWMGRQGAQRPPRCSGQLWRGCLVQGGGLHDMG